MSASAARSKTDSSAAFLWTAVYGGILIYGLYLALYSAYTIRLRAILDYGPVIHEFDPYFNYRATEVCSWECRIPFPLGMQTSHFCAISLSMK
jgi:hypothetical protein